MIKKISFNIILYFLLASLFVVSFAGDIDNDNDSSDYLKSYEIIEPRFGNNNEIFLKTNVLLISIGVIEEKPIYVSLLKVEPRTSDRVLYKNIGDIEDLNSLYLPILTPGYILDFDNDDDKNFEGMTLFEIKSSYTEKERRAISEEYIRILTLMIESKKEFINSYNEYTDKFFINAAGGIVIPLELTDEEKFLMKSYKESYINMMKFNLQYEYISPVYESIFETVVFEPENILESSNIFGYRKTVENIKPGSYKLIIEDDNGLVEEIEFNVKDQLTKENILEEKPNPVGDLLNIDK